MIESKLKLSDLIEKVSQKNTKFITITGGVCSSIGKGVLISSLGVLLKQAGYSVTIVKWDPYLNVDPGTMSPLEHGEVFVTHDGAETDLDLGHYERILGVNLTRKSSVSSGQIFAEILADEREGSFLGKCIQLVPHVVDAIKYRLLSFALEAAVDFVLLEIGGTIGDIEGLTFIEAFRQLRHDLGQNRFLHGHLSYVPFLSWSGEVKTKPTQHSINELRRAGLVPDCLFLRSDQEIGAKTIEKLSVMCGIPKDFIFQVLTWNPVYRLFIELQKQMVSEKLQHYFNITKVRASDLTAWENFISLINQSTQEISIGLVAKYVGSNDPYISVIEAIRGAGYHLKCKTKIVVIEAEHLEKAGNADGALAWEQIQKMDGILVPGGFDNRGVEGKILAVKWAREHKVPYLGLCLGMQVMLIEVARSLCSLANANSTEFNKKTSDPVISLLKEQEGVKQFGATMRLGAYPCTLNPGSRVAQAYKKELVLERHRHRYEVNNKYKKVFEGVGVAFSGIYKENNLIEVAELKDHPFMIGTQFHPEFTASPLQPHPLFLAFIDTILKKGGGKI